MKKRGISFKTLILFNFAAWVLSPGHVLASYSTPVRALAGQDTAAFSVSAEELQIEVEKKVQQVPQFKFLREKAKAMGLRVFLFGGTASAFVHYVKWDQQRIKGDPRYKGDPFDYDFTSIYRSTQDLDIVVDGDLKKMAELAAEVKAAYPQFLGNAAAKWEVRSLRHSVGQPGTPEFKEALLNDFDFSNQNTDTSSTGLVEVSESDEPAIRDLRDWDSKMSRFLVDSAKGAITYLRSPTHNKTSRYLKGQNPEIFSVIRALTKAFQFDLTFDAQSMSQMREVIKNFDENEIANIKKNSLWRLLEIGPKLFKHAVNIEYAWNMLEQMGLRKKLMLFDNVDKTGSLAWWMNKEPLRSKPVGVDGGKTAKELGIDVISHETESILAYESITRSNNGDANLLASRKGSVGELALHGDGVYAMAGEDGAKGTGLTIRFKLDPHARENYDFKIIKDKTLLILNKSAIRVMPESLKLTIKEYFQFLLDGNNIKYSDSAIQEKLRRRIRSTYTNADKKTIADMINQATILNPTVGETVLKEWNILFPDNDFLGSGAINIELYFQLYVNKHHQAVRYHEDDMFKLAEKKLNDFTRSADGMSPKNIEFSQFVRLFLDRELYVKDLNLYDDETKAARLVSSGNVHVLRTNVIEAILKRYTNNSSGSTSSGAISRNVIATLEKILSFKDSEFIEKFYRERIAAGRAGESENFVLEAALLAVLKHRTDVRSLTTLMHITRMLRKPQTLTKIDMTLSVPNYQKLVGWLQIPQNNVPPHGDFTFSEWIQILFNFREYLSSESEHAFGKSIFARLDSLVDSGQVTLRQQELYRTIKATYDQFRRIDEGVEQTARVNKPLLNERILSIKNIETHPELISWILDTVEKNYGGRDFPRSTLEFLMSKNQNDAFYEILVDHYFKLKKTPSADFSYEKLIAGALAKMNSDAGDQLKIKFMKAIESVKLDAAFSSGFSVDGFYDNLLSHFKDIRKAQALALRRLEMVENYDDIKSFMNALARNPDVVSPALMDVVIQRNLLDARYGASQLILPMLRNQSDADIKKYLVPILKAENPHVNPEFFDHPVFGSRFYLYKVLNVPVDPNADAYIRRNSIDFITGKVLPDADFYRYPDLYWKLINLNQGIDLAFLGNEEWNRNFDGNKAIGILNQNFDTNIRVLAKALFARSSVHHLEMMLAIARQYPNSTFIDLVLTSKLVTDPRIKTVLAEYFFRNPKADPSSLRRFLSHKQSRLFPDLVQTATDVLARVTGEPGGVPSQHRLYPKAVWEKHAIRMISAPVNSCRHFYR